MAARLRFPKVDDLALFTHARDESRRCYVRLCELLRARVPTAERLRERDTEIKALAAWFELHGGTLVRMSRWQPQNALFREALLDWEINRFGLKFLGLQTLSD